ncbi:hypothetical protein [Endozoicomonas arenosclerae]|uniref:hypothetical protein n=1 Tax=Endozoicomonas arenosclerae TaxID=1633495 RepID=UPI0015602A0F|nr:hypothetical protein [Endozoicomonas arenosclerae]
MLATNTLLSGQSLKQHSSLVQEGSQEVLQDPKYSAFVSNRPHFNILLCEPGVQLDLTQDNAAAFYSQNQALDEVSPYENALALNHFQALKESLINEERFFNCSGSGSSCTEDAFCDNLCPSGFRASDSIGQLLMRCNQVNKAVAPFYNEYNSDGSRNYDFSQHCERCPSGTFRNAFPLASNHSEPGYQFDCSYDCHPHRQCVQPFKQAIAGTASSDTVCDCESGHLRVVTVPADVIDRDIVWQEGSYLLASLPVNQSKAHYDSYIGKDGALKAYDFMCLKQSGLCLTHTTELEWTIGFYFDVSELQDKCFILNDSGDGIIARDRVVANLFLQGPDLHSPSATVVQPYSSPGAITAVSTLFGRGQSSIVPGSTSSTYTPMYTINVSPSAENTIPPPLEIPPYIYYTAGAIVLVTAILI